MVIKTMLLSGALAGLIGLPDLLGNQHEFGSQFTGGLGFLGIAVALLGRNRPLGIAVAALLFAFLDRAALPLQFADVPASVITIIQGTIVLAVVIANEVARRLALRSAERAGATTAGPPPDGGGGPGGGDPGGNGPDGRPVYTGVPGEPQEVRS
jgi:simple sugar transport system permease protein